ncbi:hypothetical protein V866_008596 [Kwoniella sp. B9012]
MSTQGSQSNSTTTNDDTSMTDTAQAPFESRQARRRAKRSGNKPASGSSASRQGSESTPLTEEYLRDNQGSYSSRSGVDIRMLVAKLPEHHGSKMDEPLMVVEGVTIRRRDTIETKGPSTITSGCESIFFDYCRHGVTGRVEIPTERTWTGA